MTPQEMDDLRKNNPIQKEVNKQISRRRYNVIIRTKDNEIVETYEMVSLKVAREIKQEAHTENNLADIIEDWTIDYNDREIAPKPNYSSPAPAPRIGAMNTPSIPEKKSDLISALRLAKARDNVSRSHKNVECEFHMFRIVNKTLKIDIQNTEAKIAAYLNGRKDIADFNIIYCGIATSWGMDA